MSTSLRPMLPRRAQRRAQKWRALTLVAAVFVCSLLVDTAQADFVRRGGGSPNNTFVNTAILSFMSSPRASWEQGVASSAILETYGAAWSVFAGNTPPPYSPYATDKDRKKAGALSSDIVSMASSVVQTQDSIGRLCSRITGDESTLSGSALDSASCGEAVLLAAYANGEMTGSSNISMVDGSYAQAATAQLQYLLQRAPRMSNGAISMRQAVQSYWSDGLYMSPPFIALYGLMTNNQTLLETAYNQVALYRQALRIPSGAAQGLLRHIVNGTDSTGLGNDNGAWLTGNGWGAAGMCKVMAVLSQSSYNMTSEIDDLGSWASEIVRAAMRQGYPLMRNYINDTSSFTDTGGSALIAYSTFRLASLLPRAGLGAQAAQAEEIYSEIQRNLLPNGAFAATYQVPNPLSFTSPVQRSPESMAFMALLSSARRDYYQSNVTNSENTQPTSNGAATMLAAPSTLLPFWLWTTVLASIFTVMLS